MTHPLVKRRVLLLAGLAGGVAPLASRGDVPPNRRENPERSALLALCAQLACPRWLAELCLSSLPPAERSTSSLANTLITDARIAAGGHVPAGHLAQTLRERSRDDFGAGRLAIVDGWILSLTETRLYALAALTGARQSDVG